MAHWADDELFPCYLIYSNFSTLLKDLVLLVQLKDNCLPNPGGRPDVYTYIFLLDQKFKPQ